MRFHRHEEPPDQGEFEDIIHWDPRPTARFNNGQLIWYNRAFGQLVTRKTTEEGYNQKNLSALLGEEYEAILSEHLPVGIRESRPRKVFGGTAKHSTTVLYNKRLYRWDYYARAVYDEHGREQVIVNLYGTDVTTASVDPLTDLFVYEPFGREEMKVVLDHARRAEEYSHFGVVVDINDFMKFNDKLGHQGGDAVLRGVAEALKATALRKSDIVCRMNNRQGDEFFMLYDSYTKEGSKKPTLEQVHKTIFKIAESICSSDAIKQLSGLDEPVTVSFGVAIGSKELATPEELKKSADEAMYKAKEQGKKYVHPFFTYFVSGMMSQPKSFTLCKGKQAYIA